MLEIHDGHPRLSRRRLLSIGSLALGGISLASLCRARAAGRGTVYGESDRQAAYVKDLPVSTGDICATIFEAMGIDPDTMLPDRSGWPFPIANGGHAIRGSWVSARSLGGHE
jgi:hypothetical protein